METNLTPKLIMIAQHAELQSPILALVEEGYLLQTAEQDFERLWLRWELMDAVRTYGWRFLNSRIGAERYLIS